jgi:hypothetical protein
MTEAQPFPRQFRYATATALDISAGTDRRVSYVLSDSSVARDGHRILTGGWELAAYLTNPVFLWAHDDQMPPIGRMAEISIRGEQLVGTVDYAPAEISEFADMIFRMVKGLFLNTVSVSWNPLEWRFAGEKSRQGGIDFVRQELLEVSQVPVPALATAVATARSGGINTAPLVEWAEHILDGGATMVIPREELESLRRAAMMPKATRTAATPEVETVAEVILSQVSLTPTRDERRAILQRGLAECGWLAMLMGDLAWLLECCEFEAAGEGDNSPVPAKFKSALGQLGAVLIEMTTEEVGELVESGDDYSAEEDMAEEPRAAASRLARRLDPVAALRIATAMRSYLRGEQMTIKSGGNVLVTSRAGRVLSADNEACLRDAHEMMTRGCEMVRSVVDQVETAEQTNVADMDSMNARAMRERKAKALILKARHCA